MKHLMHTLALCLIGLWGSCQLLAAQDIRPMERDWRNDRQKIVIMSYNIKDGFGWGKKDEDRMARQAAWIKAQNPDVLALNELCGFTESMLKDYAARYGHPYVASVKEEGYPVGLTSKYPFEVIARKVEGYGHGLLHCRTLGMDFLVTHLNPHKAEIRNQEARRIVEYIEEHHLEKCILLGDLNAHSPFDASWTDRDLGDYTAISTFMAASLHDICYLFTPDGQRFSFPTPIGPGTPKGAYLKTIQERIDYIFVTDALREQCVDAAIHNGEDTGYLSDHYPISISMFIPKDK